MNSKMNGVINIYKEKGYTSHDVVAIVKGIVGRCNKVGHTGTLDPDATGVLPICIGKATKLSDRIMSGTKEYIATLKLGITTDTQDISGNVLSTSEVDVSIEDVVNTIREYIGEYEQLPPMYSAIKVNGKKLYELAREGKEVERKKRTINIFDIEIIDKNIEDNEFKIRVHCSKGTYIRTLCHDIGQSLGVGATMTTLERTKTGSFDTKSAIKINELKELANDNKVTEALISLENMLLDKKKIIVPEVANKYLYNGNKISLNYIKEKIIDEEVILFDECNNLIGLYRLNKDDKLLEPIIFLMDK